MTPGLLWPADLPDVLVRARAGYGETWAYWQIALGLRPTRGSSRVETRGPTIFDRSHLKSSQPPPKRVFLQINPHTYNDRYRIIPASGGYCCLTNRSASQEGWQSLHSSSMSSRKLPQPTPIPTPDNPGPDARLTVLGAGTKFDDDIFIGSKRIASRFHRSTRKTT